MASPRRTERINSLLREVISEVIRSDVRHPDLHSLISVTRVDVTRDLHHAKVYVSIIGTEEQKHKSLDALEAAAGFIAVAASKKVTIRYFPSLLFRLDDSVDKQMRIESVINQVQRERESREPGESN